MVANHKKNNTPKWLIAEDIICTRWFIIHTEFPRFIAEIFDDEVDKDCNIIKDVKLIDKYPTNESTAAEMARLIKEAGDALLRYDEINEMNAEQARIEEDELENDEA